jgi:RimJ/RimL family protein N-acetyltransferase
VNEPVLDYSRYFWQGKRVRLRPLRVEDAEQAFLSSLDSPSRQLLQLGVELPTSAELLKSSLEKYAGCKDNNGVIVFAIENLEGVNVGGVSYHSRDRKNGTFSFGVVIDREHRKQGYARDAVRVLLRYGFWERRYQKCNSACVHINEASIRLHETLGFVQEGLRRRQLFLNGRFYDDVLFGLTREEFDALEARE